MNFTSGVHFGFGGKVRTVLQTEGAECGLACFVMIARYHGFTTDLPELRRRFPVSLKGVTLADLTRIAGSLKMGSRPLKLDLEDLPQLQAPCILHWNLNHFVVLERVRGQRATIHDPAFGIRNLTMEEVSRHFTGVALELWPQLGFVRESEETQLSLRRVLGRVTGLYRALGQILLLAAALEVFALLTPILTQVVLDDVLPSQDLNLLNLAAVGFGLLLVMQTFVTALRSWALVYLGVTFNVQWRGNVLSHLVSLPVDYFGKRHLGDIVSRFGSVDVIQQTLTATSVETILDGMMAVATLAMMYVFCPTLCIVSVLAMLLYVLGRVSSYGPLRAATMEQIVHSAKQSTHVLETLRGMRTLKLFQRQSERIAGWLGLYVNQTNAALRVQRLAIAYRLANRLLFGAENVIVMWLGARQIIGGAYTVGIFMAYNAYRVQFDSRVASLVDNFFELKMLRLQTERLADIVLSEPEANSERLVVSDERGGKWDIELRGIRFRYSENEPWVLDGVDLTVKAGESVAIVGPSGCGKTTLISLVLGILAPTDGEILLNGKSIRQLGVETLRQLAGTVMQEDVLFAGSIADNISFFDAQADQARIEECAKIAAIHSDIVGMPMGYNTLVGDMGTVLSGGQKQRVLLARALYKRPSILILDEATSHLDIERERQISEAIGAMKITRVIVAHRPETVRFADRVIVLENGRVTKMDCLWRSGGRPSLFSHAAPIG